MKTYSWLVLIVLVADVVIDVDAKATLLQTWRRKNALMKSLQKEERNTNEDGVSQPPDPPGIDDKSDSSSFVQSGHNRLDTDRKYPMDQGPAEVTSGTSKQTAKETIVHKKVDTRGDLTAENRIPDQVLGMVWGILKRFQSILLQQQPGRQIVLASPRHMGDIVDETIILNRLFEESINTQLQKFAGATDICRDIPTKGNRSLLRILQCYLIKSLTALSYLKRLSHRTFVIDGDARLVIRLIALQRSLSHLSTQLSLLGNGSGNEGDNAEEDSEKVDQHQQQTDPEELVTTFQRLPSLDRVPPNGQAVDDSKSQVTNVEHTVGQRTDRNGQDFNLDKIHNQGTQTTENNRSKDWLLQTFGVLRDRINIRRNDDKQQDEHNNERTATDVEGIVEQGQGKQTEMDRQDTEIDNRRNVNGKIVVTRNQLLPFLERVHETDRGEDNGQREEADIKQGVGQGTDVDKDPGVDNRRNVNGEIVITRNQLIPLLQRVQETDRGEDNGQGKEADIRQGVGQRTDVDKDPGVNNRHSEDSQVEGEIQGKIMPPLFETLPVGIRDEPIGQSQAVDEQGEIDSRRNEGVRDNLDDRTQQWLLRTFGVLRDRIGLS